MKALALGWNDFLYTRFFSAVAVGINITYISPALVQEISSPGTYNLDTVIHTVQCGTFQLATVYMHTHAHTPTHTRG